MPWRLTGYGSQKTTGTLRFLLRAAGSMSFSASGYTREGADGGCGGGAGVCVYPIGSLFLENFDESHQTQENKPEGEAQNSGAALDHPTPVEAAFPHQNNVK